MEICKAVTPCVDTPANTYNNQNVRACQRQLSRGGRLDRKHGCITEFPGWLAVWPYPVMSMPTKHWVWRKLKYLITPSYWQLSHMLRDLNLDRGERQLAASGNALDHMATRAGPQW